MYSVVPRHLSLSFSQRASGEAGRGIAQGEPRHLSLGIIQKGNFGDFKAFKLGFKARVEFKHFI